MTSVWDVIFYILTFLSVYAQVFFLITFLENRKRIITRNDSIQLTKYPAVTVIVPCWNEEKTIYKTVHSLLNLNYPKDQLKIFLIDDGSTDKTWDVISEFSGYPNIKTFRKENGGKYTALNLGLENVQTEFLGCLDADSEVHKEALIRIMSYFEKDPNTMAVTPSLLVHNIENVIQKVQKVEYDMSVYLKKMLVLMGAIHVTPGPFTIFNKKVFDDLGPYRHAHNTEDMEIAYRMQKNHYKIEQCNDAYVYTNTPSTVVKLYKQRLRWIYGSINNTIDYRNVIFKKKYGDFSLFTVPFGIISIVTAGFVFVRVVFNLLKFLFSKITEIRTVGFDLSPKMNYMDSFFIDTRSLLFIAIFLFSAVIFSIILGRKMTNNKTNFSFDIFYFSFIYGLIAPIWIMKAIIDTIFSKKPSWR